MNNGLLQMFWMPLGLFMRHRVLTWEMTKREVRDRYADQMLGSLWALGHPILLVTVYVIVFKYVFRVGALSEAGQDYTVFLLSGMLPWLTFQDSLNKTTSSLVANARLVKQIVFPIEILPAKAVFSSFVNQLIGSVLLVGYVLVTTRTLSPAYALLPFLWLMQWLAMLGFGFLLSAIGAYFRDLSNMVLMFGTVGIYTMPICYTPELVPSSLRFLLYLNPFSYMIWCYQDICYHGELAHPWAWCVFPGGAVLLFYFGFYSFQRLKVYFGSIL